MAIRVEASAHGEGDRALDVRAANDRIAEKAAQLRFVSRVPMMCECSDPACRTLVMITLGEYRAIGERARNILTAAGHDADRADLVKKTADYEIRRLSHHRDGNCRSA
jgi:hypothetical protein